jgi:hypothetical protein
MAWKSMRAAFRAGLHESRWFLAAANAQLVSSVVICSLAGRSALAGPVDAYATILEAVAVFAPLALAAACFQRRMAIADDTSIGEAYGRAWLSLRSEVLTPEYFAAILITLAVAPLALSAFSAAKQAIPLLNPFTWDRLIAALGARVDGGVPLWRVLQPALGHPRTTIVLDWFYHRVWTSLLLGVFSMVLLTRPGPLRQRFLFCFVLVFLVVGNLLALALSSAGPPYFTAVAPGTTDQFAPLFDYLRSVDARHPLLSFRGEQVLWSAYRHDVEGFGFGISAMPSVHVASAVLVALFGFRLSRSIGLVLSFVALGTFVASVALGWHYALDGYVGALVSWGIWSLSGLVTRETDPTRSS